jgi:L-fucose isomerase-like protein
MVEVDAVALKTVLRYFDNNKVDDEKVREAIKKLGSNLWYAITVNGGRTEWIKED